MARRTADRIPPEELLAALLRKTKYSGFVREHQGIEGRKFRFDFAWLKERVAVEVQGSTWVTGGHSTGAGIERDCEKLDLAACAGWRVLLFTSSQIRRNPDFVLGCISKLLTCTP